MTRQEFIQNHTNDVLAATKGTGLFPSVVMAQMIIESADSNGVAGNGITATQANNYFGIKADSSWTGKKMAFSTPKDGQPTNYFRVYQSPVDSIADHTKFLQVNSRYPAAGVFSSATPEEQIKAIAKAGYAEAPNYAQSIIDLINSNNLKSLDSMLSGYKTIAFSKKHYIAIPIAAVAFLGLIYVGYKLLGGNGQKASISAAPIANIV